MIIDYEFACQDDCLDKMVPSDLRKLICERDQAYRNIDVITAERDALAAQVEKLKERNRKLDVDLLRALFYAPSSPVSPDKAYEIEVWYGKFKQVHLASKG